MEAIEQKSTIDVRRWLMIGLIVTAGLIVVGGGVFVYQKAMSGRKTAGQESEAPTSPLSEETLISPTPELLPVPTIAKEELKIQILNGSGVPGLAGKAASYLEGLGYADVKTGNASAYDYPETEIQIKKNQTVFLEQLIKDLSEEYTLATETGTLTEDEDFDVVITLGKE